MPTIDNIAPKSATPMDIGDQLLYERKRNANLIRVFWAMVVITLLALSVTAGMGVIVQDVSRKQDRSKARGCAVIKHFHIEGDYGCT